jgi:hypothetical protein
MAGDAWPALHRRILLGAALFRYIVLGHARIAPVVVHIETALRLDAWQSLFENQPYRKACPNIPLHPSFMRPSTST